MSHAARVLPWLWRNVWWGGLTDRQTDFWFVIDGGGRICAIDEASVKLCSDEKKCSCGRFTGQLTPSDPLQTIFQLLSGRVPAVATVKQPEHKHTWFNKERVLKVMFSFAVLWKWKMGRLEATSGCNALQWDRRSRRPAEGHRHHGRHSRYERIHRPTDGLYRCLYKLIVFCRAASKGLLHAAHVCYLTASAPFGVFTQKADRLVLLGSSHRWAATASCQLSV